MPLYFFDIIDSGSQRDDTGTECADDEAVRKIAKQTLPDIAREEIPFDGDRRFFTVVARDQAGQPVYTATLSFVGIRLRERPEAIAAAD